ncbi:MAG: S-layer homology domain-containing protein, partial [Oscillibacter sp.]|nr:S-layer homology domain-containing protein [Oscillibacter sp.]
RYAEYLEMSTHHKGDLSRFHDHHETSDWAKEAKEWAIGAGLITGKGNNTLDPSGDATRAEVATILERFVTLLVG